MTCYCPAASKKRGRTRKEARMEGNQSKEGRTEKNHSLLPCVMPSRLFFHQRARASVGNGSWMCAPAAPLLASSLRSMHRATRPSPCLLPLHAVFPHRWVGARFCVNPPRVSHSKASPPVPPSLILCLLLAWLPLASALPPFSSVCMRALPVTHLAAGLIRCEKASAG
jgi:hypothetical protein